MSKKNKFQGVFLQTPRAEAPDPVTGVDCPPESELETWHKNRSFVGLPILSEHHYNQPIGTIIRTFTEKQGERTIHKAVFRIDKEDAAEKMRNGEVPFLSMAHRYVKEEGGQVIRFPTHIASTVEPARAGTSVEVCASVSGGTNSYVQAPSVPGEKIKLVEDPVETMAANPPVLPQTDRVIPDEYKSLAPNASGYLAGIAFEQIGKVVDARLKEQAEQARVKELQEQNARYQEQIKAFNAEQQAKQQQTQQQPAVDPHVKALEDRLKAMEEALKSAQAAPPAGAAPSQAAAPVRSTKEEPTDDPREPNPPPEKKGAKREKPDTRPEEPEHAALSFFRKARDGFTEEQTARLAEVAAGSRPADEEDGRLFTQMLNQWREGMNLLYQSDTNKFRDAAVAMLGPEATDEELEAQVEYFRKHPSVFNRWRSNSAAPSTARNALASMFNGQRVVTEVAANAKSALSAGGKANPASSGAKPATSEPAKTGMRGIFANYA